MTSAAQNNICRLAVPSFDLVPLSLSTTSDSGGKLEVDRKIYVLVPGGGGSVKSGVKNQIVSTHFNIQ